jgi:hypothetical protein
VLGAALFGTLGVACAGEIGAQSNASNLDAASGDFLPLEASAADGSVPDVGVEPNGSGDGPSGEAGMFDEGTLLGGGNLIVNPSCEIGTIEWTTLSGSPLASSTTFVHTGDTASCLSYDRTDPEMLGETSGPSYDGPMQDITSVVVAGHTYTASAWVLWAPPDAGDAGDPSAGSFDGAAAMGSDASAEAGAGAGYGPQNVDITVRQTCAGTSTYTRLGTQQAVPQATWTQVVATTFLIVSPGCDLQLYVEGPDVGLDLYVAEVTLSLLE